MDFATTSPALKGFTVSSPFNSVERIYSIAKMCQQRTLRIPSYAVAPVLCRLLLQSLYPIQYPAGNATQSHVERTCFGYHNKLRSYLGMKSLSAYYASEVFASCMGKPFDTMRIGLDETFAAASTRSPGVLPTFPLLIPSQGDIVTPQEVAEGFSNCFRSDWGSAARLHSYVVLGTAVDNQTSNGNCTTTSTTTNRCYYMCWNSAIGTQGKIILIPHMQLHELIGVLEEMPLHKNQILEKNFIVGLHLRYTMFLPFPIRQSYLSEGIRLREGGQGYWFDCDGGALAQRPWKEIISQGCTACNDPFG
eukprot:PhF_6_TR41647/c0_g1_i1/m.63137